MLLSRGKRRYLLIILCIFCYFAYANHDTIASKSFITETSLLTPEDIAPLIHEGMPEMFAQASFVVELQLQINKQSDTKNIQENLDVLSIRTMQQKNNLIISLPAMALKEAKQLKVPSGLLQFQKNPENTQEWQIFFPMQKDATCETETYFSKHSLYFAFFCSNKEDNVYKVNNGLADKIQYFDSYDVDSWRYFLVIAIMLCVLVVLYIIRLRQNTGGQVSNIALEQVKILDSKNKIIVVCYNETRYVLGLSANSITLIDKIPISSDDGMQSSNTDNKDLRNEDLKSNDIAKNLQTKHNFLTLLMKK